LDPDIGHLGSPLQKTKEKGKRRTMVGGGNSGGWW